MNNRIYVGNLSFSATESSLSDLFSPHGTVSSCHLVTDRDTGRSKGFAFVEMSTHDEAATAISALSGKEHEGRVLNVSEARPRENRPSSSFGSSGGSRY